MNKKRPVLHVGMYKSATTSLQNNLIGKHSEIENIGKPYRSHAYQKFVQAIVYQDKIEFDLETQKRALETLMQDASGKRSIVLSEEDLTHHDVADRELIADRLHALFSDARVLFTLRNQLTLIPSMYVFFMRGHHRVGTLNDWLIEHKRTQGQFFKALKYNQIIRCYMERFGRGNVEVLCYEDLLKNPEGFICSICNFLEISADEGVVAFKRRTAENTRLSSRQARYSQFRARFFPNTAFSKFYPAALKGGFDRFLSSSGRAEQKLSEEWISYFHSMYSEGNRSLEVDYSLDLRGRGYPI